MSGAEQVPRPPMPARLARARLLAVFFATFGLIAVGGGAVVAAVTPELPAARCPGGERLCGSPPIARPAGPQTLWRSAELGFRLEYGSQVWRVVEEDARSLTLGDRATDLVLTISGHRGGDAQARFDARLDELEGEIVGLGRDSSPRRVVLGPNIGYRDAVGGSYAGVVDAPQGIRDVMTVTLMAAAERDVTLVVTVATTQTRSRARRQALEQVDTVLNTVRWAAP